MNRAKTTKNIQQVAKQIVKEFQPESVVLFGSWAWGTPHQDSDVDLCVIKETRDTRALARKIDGAIFPRPFPLDLVVYSPSQIKKTRDMFILDILKHGKILYEQ